MKILLTAATVAAAASLATAGNVTPGVIFGSGNANGSYTIGSGGGIEIGLRAKVRYNSSGQPENTFNWDGGNTYTFDPADGNAPAGRATWNWEWSINSNADGTGDNLNNFIYELTIYNLADGAANSFTADLINDPASTNAIDHAFGNNATTAADNEVGNVGNYATMISTYNVAQNSSNFAFLTSSFAGSSMGDWNPGQSGTFLISLMAYERELDGSRGDLITGSTINVHVVPLPAAAWAGLATLGAAFGVRKLRRR